MQIRRSELIEQNHGNIWKYLLSIENGLSAMHIYKIEALHYIKQKQDNFNDIIKGKAEMNEEEKRNSFPGDFCEIDNTKISLSFLVWLNTQNFIQTSRNCFDYLAQIIFDYYPNITNKKIDFGVIKENKNKISDERVVEWISNIENSECFNYINDFSNILKHNHDIPTSISLKTSNLEMVCYIPKFEKDDNIHFRTELNNKMTEIFNFTFNSYKELLSYFINNG